MSLPQTKAEQTDRRTAPGMDATEVAACAAVLGTLTPSALRDDPALAPLLKVGVALFGPEVLRQRFGQSDAIEYLRELNGHRKLLKKLERLHREVDKAHAIRKAEAAGCGMNVQREARLKAIEAACAREDGGVKSFSGKRSLLLRAPAAADCDGDTGAATSGNENAAAAAGEAAAGEAVERTERSARAEPPAAQPPPTAQPPQAVPVSQVDGARLVEEGEQALGSAALTEAMERTAALPVGSFRRHCNVCKVPFGRVHHFYHQLCPPCAELNYAKRLQSADLAGCVVVVVVVSVVVEAEVEVVPTANYQLHCQQPLHQLPTVANTPLPITE